MTIGLIVAVLEALISKKKINFQKRLKIIIFLVIETLERSKNHLIDLKVKDQKGIILRITHLKYEFK